MSPTETDNPKFCFTLSLFNTQVISLTISGTADFRPKWLIVTFVSLFMLGMFFMTFGPSLNDFYKEMRSISAMEAPVVTMDDRPT